VGCSNSPGELSQGEEKTLKDNFTRELTPAEIAQMRGGSAPAEPADKKK